MRKQATLAFAPESEKADRMAAKRSPCTAMLSAAEILLGNPERYPGMLQYLAIMTLHRKGKPHAAEECPRCRREKERIS